MIPIRAKVPSQRWPVVTVALVLANAAAFMFELGLGIYDQERLFYLYGMVPVRYTHPQLAAEAGLPSSYWPFLTYMFLHGGLMHLIGNMWSLWLFGDKVEDRMGHIRFLLFYILCGLAAAITHMALCSSSAAPVVGASGAVAGIMGAYFVMYPFSRILAAIPIFIFIHFIEVPAFVYLGFWFLLQFFSGTAALGGAANCVGGVAFWTHVGGFIMGILLLRSFVPDRAGGRIRRIGW